MKPRHGWVGAAVVAGLAVALARFDPDPDPPTPHEPLGAGLPEMTALRPLVKDRVARDAAAGRRSLPAAAALFDAVDRLPPEPADLYLPDLPDMRLPPAERQCRRVIEWVVGAVGADPAGETAVNRLEAALNAEVARPDGIVLVAPAPRELDRLLDQARERLQAIRRRAARPAGP